MLIGKEHYKCIATNVNWVAASNEFLSGGYLNVFGYELTNITMVDSIFSLKYFQYHPQACKSFSMSNKNFLQDVKE